MTTMVVTTATLEKIAQALPTTKEKLAELDGMGPTRAERFGDPYSRPEAR